MPDFPRVSVIIVTWNAQPLLAQCLPSVVASTYPNLEILVADNASTDGSAAWVHHHFSEVRVVRHPENWAFCRGNNEALPHATGDLIVLLNNDVEVPPGWLQPLVDAFITAPRLGAAQPKILQHRDRDHFEYAGAAGGFLDAYGFPFARGRLFDTVEPDRGQYDTPRDVFWATGAALMLRRAALDDVGLLDERFVMHMEEIDLCWRLQRHGYAVRAIPASEVYHIGGGSLPQGSPRKVYFNFRNNLLLLYKNLPPSAWRRVLPRRIAFDALAALRALVAGRPAEAAAIGRAHRDAHQLRAAYDHERPAETDPAVLPPYRGSIVFDYFVRRRKRFSDLPPERFRGPGA